jgi:hypothetical protein
LTATRVGPRTVTAPVSLLLLVALRTGASSLAAVDADNGIEPALTLFEDLDYATECIMLTTVTSPAAGIECVVLIFKVGHHLA